MYVQNCPLVFRFRPAQGNDYVTKSVFSCKGPTRKEAEPFDFICFLPPCTLGISYTKATHKCNTHSVKQLSHHGWAPPDTFSSQRWVENISGCKGNNEIVSEHCRTSICQPGKDRPDLSEAETRTVCLESKAYSSETFKG